MNKVKTGDYVMVEYNGKLTEGLVTQIDPEDQKACVETSVQQFWYNVSHLYAIPLTDEQLLNFNFEKEVLSSGSVKYKKGAFRLMTKTPNDFTNIEMWYREDRRQNPDVHTINELQNQYLDMTKVHLTKEKI